MEPYIHGKGNPYIHQRGESSSEFFLRRAVWELQPLEVFHCIKVGMAADWQSRRSVGVETAVEINGDRSDGDV